jgi:hypothetical protein
VPAEVSRVLEDDIDRWVAEAGSVYVVAKIPALVVELVEL